MKPTTLDQDIETFILNIRNGHLNPLEIEKEAQSLAERLERRDYLEGTKEDQKGFPDAVYPPICSENHPIQQCWSQRKDGTSRFY